MSDIMHEINARLAAREKLRALLDSGGLGTIKHRMLDDMLYDTGTEGHIRFLLGRIEQLQARVEQLEAQLEKGRDNEP